MKYPQILETLTRTPLLITPAAAEAMLQMFTQHAQMSAEDFQAAREGTGECGEKVELEQMTVVDGIANIPVNGPLGIRLGKFEKGAGAVDYLDIMADLKAANENPDVQTIVLHFDTPGGMFAGLPETTDLMASIQKPIYAYVPAGATCASAGMWLAAGTDGIFASASSQLGSIGVYCAYMDLTGMAEKKGIKVKVFSSGKYKGMGIPGTELTTDQEAYLQDSVMQLAEEFYAHIRANRGDIPDDAMQGQMFRADEAIRLGLADDLVKSDEELMALLS
jgi:protease-4